MTDGNVLGSAGELVVKILEQNARDANWVSNQLYNGERLQRLALEVWVRDFQNALWDAHGGTYREMDAVLKFFAYPPMGYDEELHWAKQHRDWTEPLGG